jgi:hypothetical protein
MSLIERDSVDGSRQRWFWNAVIPALLLLIALLPRLVVLGPLVNPDELGWLDRSVRFYDALSRGDWASTLQAFHPGVVPMWGFGAMMCARYGLGQLQTWLAFEALPMADLARAALFFPMAISVLTVLAVYGLVRRLAGRETALYAALLLAVDPYYLAFTYLIHMDLTHGSLMVVAALLWINYLYRPRRWLYLVGGGIVGGLALLTRSASVYLVPFSLLAVGVFFLAENLNGGQPYLKPGWGRWTSRTFIAWLVGLGVLILTVFALWPALWVDPGEVVGRLGVGILRSVENAHPAPVYLQGEIITEDPGTGYYWLVLLFRLRPLTLVLVILNPVLLMLAWRRLSRQRRAAWGLALAYPAFYFLQMSLATHKLERYMLPVGIALTILAGISLAVMARWLTEWIVRLRRSTLVRACRIVVLSAAIVLLAIPWLRLAPYFSAYYSPLAGGAEQAKSDLTLSSGLGLSQAADYLNAKPNAQELLVPSFYHYVFQYYFEGDTQRPTEESWAGLPVNAQYAVLTLGQVQRDIYPATLDFFLPRQPEQAIRINNIDYAWIYQVPRRELSAAPPIQQPVEASFEGRVRLLGYDVGRTEDELLVTLYWQLLATMHRELRVTLQLVDDADQVIVEQNDPPWSGDVAVLAWPGGLAVQDEHRIPLTDLPPGDHHLTLSLEQRYRDGQERLLPLDGVGETELILGPVDLSPVPTPAQVVSEGNLGGLVRLVGFDLPEVEVAAGTTLPLTLTWECMGTFEADYTVFVHLVGADGRPLAQIDGPPLGGIYPTSFWDSGERLTDPYLLYIPPDLPPGEYELLVGMYLLSTGVRLPVLGVDGQVLGDSISLGAVTVEIP